MILFVNGCVRKNSRTKELADTLLSTFDDEIQELVLKNEDLPTLDEEALEKRTKASQSGDFSADYFRYAKQFQQADTIVIAAPFWDLSFPAIVKKYIESICVAGLTFKYNEQGVPVGLCKAKKLYYVTTSGGTIFNNEFCFGYIKSLATNMFGVEECVIYTAENLDIIGNDVEKIMKESKDRILKNI